MTEKEFKALRPGDVVRSNFTKRNFYVGRSLTPKETGISFHGRVLEDEGGHVLSILWEDEIYRWERPTLQDSLRTIWSNAL